MTRWFSKRWVWAAVTGASMTVGIAASQAQEGPPKVGAVVSLNIDGKGDREFKVIKVERQKDGSYHSELKDTKTGETITLVDTPNNTPPAPSAPTKESESPAPEQSKPKPRDPQVPPGADATKEKEKEKEKERRPILNRIFGDRDKDKEKSPSMSEPVKPESTESGKKPGIIGRTFGPKKPTGPSMSASNAPVAKPPIQTTPLGLGGAPQPLPNTMPGTKPGALGGIPNAKPTTVEPAIAPPALTQPAPLPVPQLPSTPVPSAPGSGLPPIPMPMPPGGTSSTQPIPVVVPVAHVQVAVSYVSQPLTFDREVAPWVVALQSMTASEARLTAAKTLAECRDSSTEGVKCALFQAARVDSSAEVRAACIKHLCELGYDNPHFLNYLRSAGSDADAAVRAAATEAYGKMVRK